MRMRLPISLLILMSALQSSSNALLTSFAQQRQLRNVPRRQLHISKLTPTAHFEFVDDALGLAKGFAHAEAGQMLAALQQASHGMSEAEVIGTLGNVGNAGARLGGPAQS